MFNPIVEINNLRFSWGSRAEPVLDIESLTIEPGQSLFIQGPSGSGKTSLLNLIGVVTAPDSGVVKILDQDVSELRGSAKDKFRADHVGFIFQQFNLVPYLSVLENVTLPCHFSKLRKSKTENHDIEARRLLTDLGMARDNLLNKPVTELSVGQQQRVAAARALIGNPEIIIADEPTSALDSDAREAFIELLFQECKQSNSTLVFVSHDGSLAKLFDQQIDLPTINQASIKPDPVH